MDQHGRHLLVQCLSSISPQASRRSSTSLLHCALPAQAQLFSFVFILGISLSTLWDMMTVSLDVPAASEHSDAVQRCLHSCMGNCSLRS